MLTLPATGSRDEQRLGGDPRKAKLAFASRCSAGFSVLDPTLTFTLPPRAEIANGVADAFIFIVEQYLTYPGAAWCRTRPPGLLQTLSRSAWGRWPRRDYDVRASLMWVAARTLNGPHRGQRAWDWATT